MDDPLDRVRDFCVKNTIRSGMWNAADQEMAAKTCQNAGVPGPGLTNSVWGVLECFPVAEVTCWKEGVNTFIMF